MAPIITLPSTSVIFPLILDKHCFFIPFDIQNETKQEPAYKKYFSHGTSHHLGLDTHDYCDLKIPFEKNNVLTVEPGIYINEEGFGKYQR